MYYLQSFDLDMNNKILLPGTLPQFKDKLMFVMTKAAWCGHCVHSTPEFEAAAKESDVIFCYADITGETPEEKEIKDKVKFFKDFKGFPNFAIFKNGVELKPFSGERKKQSFISFVNSCKI